MMVKTAGFNKKQTTALHFGSYLYSFILFLCLFSSAPSFSQSKSLLFDRLTVENGLRNPSVLQLMQDDKGFIWMVTPTGIVRYDGYESKYYRPYLNEHHPYRPRMLAVLFQDRDGIIWLGLTEIHRANLFRYDPMIDDFVPFLYDPAGEKNPIEDGIMSFGEDIYGNLLVGTSGVGLYILDKSDLEAGKIIVHHKPEPDLDQGFPSSDVFHPILMDKMGNNWMPTYDGISKYQPKEGIFSNFKIPNPSGGQSVDCREILFGDEKTLWVGTHGAGLWKFDVEEERFVKNFLHAPKDPLSLPGNEVYNIEAGPRGQLWISVSASNDNSSKLALFNPITEEFKRIHDRANANSVNPFAIIMDIMADRSGNIWLATWQTGIFRHNSNKDAFLIQRWPVLMERGTEENFINSFVEGPQNNIWIGGTDGLWKWDRLGSSLQHFKAKPTQYSRTDVIGAQMVALGEKRIVFSYGKELHTFDLSSKQFTKLADPVRVEPQVYRQSDGTVWAFNEDGICRISPTKQEVELVCDSDLITSGIVVSFAEESPNDLWIGMGDSGLLHFDPSTKKVKRFLDYYGIHDIVFDQTGQFWVITHSSGLKIFDRETEKLIDLAPAENERIGQPEEMVLLPNGQLWITTSKGIVQFDPATRKVLRRFAPNNWQLPSQFWRWNSHTPPLLSSSGELFFSSPNGVLYFHPDSIQIDSMPPQIVLTDFYLANSRLKPGIDSILSIDISYADTIVLGYQQNDFTIHFAALHYKAPAENLYRFRLDNFNPPGEWSPATTQRFAPYPNMRPGHYRFRVQAANSGGVWTQDESQETQLTIIIRHAWYNNAWAYVVYLFLLISGIIFGYRLLIRRQLQRAETERLRELEAVKSGLYTNITHEFRTPLTLILGQVQQIREGWEVVPRNLLDSISRNGNQLLRLVNQLLGIATIETGNLELQPVRSEIVSFFERNVTSFAAMAKLQELHLAFRSDPKELFMDFDPSYVKQIIDNLLSNAIKFTSAGGHIICTLAKTENQVIFEVEDTGIGIDSEDLPHIFDRFYRSKKQHPNSRIKSGEGAGIGLAFSKELVELMKGEIRVQSTPGQGTRFSIYLPITHSAPFQKELVNEKMSTIEFNLNNDDRQPHSSSDHQTSPEAPILLIVEDHADVRSYLRTCLESNYQVLEAVDGQVGHQLAQQVIPDLVISDVMMPKMDGYELCHSLKSTQSTSHIPIILLTAKADAQSRLTGLEKGADAYLAKPFLKQELLIRVEKLLELRAQLQFFYQSLSAESLIEALPVPEPEEAEFVNQVKNLVLQQLDQGQFGVQKLADDLFLSRSQLNRKMQALMGIPAVELIRDLRLTKAIELLRKEELTITEIAYKTGFSDPRYFSRVFKQVHGITPSQFRQGHSPS